ncbi:DUF3147 family protein [Bradyrhizobium lablabi]|uniref:DUF3147 family protein n=1 Tax=Bradyrhizobium lablabi TaxID=722472 RepID=UPI001BA6D4A2|nr:DUF3147 family protein [Bradyrhizobium lablabi]MBR1125091.1 DUF3147 family protein [Bradyrhizobium lablabi]
MIHLKFAALKEGRWYEYPLRFVLGGLATCLAGLVADFGGPSAGGLFLAFPAIFLASVGMIESHERRRKREKGMQGARRGRQAAALEAQGAVCGSAGLAAFAMVVWFAAPALPFPAALALALAAWLAVAVAAWRTGYFL